MDAGSKAVLGAPGRLRQDDPLGPDAWSGDRALIAVDDLHALWGTEAEATLERLLAHLPPGVVMVAATRRAPSFNLCRLRVWGELCRLLHELGMRSRLVREYLARNVLDDLPIHVRDFLFQTGVLGRLSATHVQQINRIRRFNSR